jgi:hypothetical protein
VPARERENGRRICVPEHLRDGVAFMRFRKMADVSAVQKEFRCNHWPVDAPPLGAVMFVVVPELVLRVPDKGLCGGCLHGSLCDLDTQSSSMVIRRPCPPIGLEGGAGERVQGARAAYGTCFVCADRPGRPVIPDGAAYQLIAGFVPLKGY